MMLGIASKAEPPHRVAFSLENAPGISLLGAASSDGKRHRSNHARSHYPRCRGRCAGGYAFEAVQAQRLSRTH